MPSWCSKVCGKADPAEHDAVASSSSSSPQELSTRDLSAPNAKKKFERKKSNAELHVERMQEKLEEGESVLEKSNIESVEGAGASSSDAHKESVAHKTHPTLLAADASENVASKKTAAKGTKNGKQVVRTEADAEAGKARAALREKFMAELLTEAEKKGETLSKTELKRR